MDENLDEVELYSTITENLIDFSENEISLELDQKSLVNSEAFYVNSTRKIKKMSRSEQREAFSKIKQLNNQILLEYFKITSNKELLKLAYNDMKNNNFDKYIEIENYFNVSKENIIQKDLKQQQKEIMEYIKSILDDDCKNNKKLYLTEDFILKLDNNLDFYSKTIKNLEKQLLNKINTTIKSKQENKDLIGKLKLNIHENIITDDDFLNNEIKNIQHDIKEIELKSGLNIVDLKLTIRNVFLSKNKIKSYKDRLVESNLPLVIHSVKPYRNKGVDVTDLIQEGNIGLIKAVDKFDLDKGNQFSTYAVWWIKQGVLRALVEISNDIRIPVYISDSINKLKKYLADNNMSYSDINNNNIETIANELKLTKSKILNILQTNTKFYPIHETAENNKGEKQLSLEEILPSSDVSMEDIVFKEQSNKILNSLIDTLPQRSADALKLYFGIGLNDSQSLEEVGILLGLTKERIRQLNLESFEKIKKTHFRSNILNDLKEF